MNLTGLVDEFIAYKRDGDNFHNPCSKRTLRSYRGMLRGFIRFVVFKTRRESAQSFTSTMAAAYLEYRSTELNLDGNTLNLDSTALREFAQWGVKRRHWLAESVDEIPMVRKVKRLPRPFDDAEIHRLMEVPLDERDAAVRALLLYAGLRVSEVCGLRLQDLTPPHQLPDGTSVPGRVRAWGKGSKERILPMPAPLWAALLAYLQTLSADQTPLDRHLFTHRKLVRLEGGQRAYRDHQPWTPYMVQARARKWGGVAKVGTVKPHRFRHAYATVMLETNRDDIRLVQELLGHASVATTQIYTKLSGRRRDEAVANFPTFGRLRTVETVQTDCAQSDRGASEEAGKSAESNAGP